MMEAEWKLLFKGWERVEPNTGEVKGSRERMGGTEGENVERRRRVQS